MEQLLRIWHASRKRLLFWTFGSVPLLRTCLCSNCWDQIPRTCHVFTRPFTLNTPRYFSILATCPHLTRSILENIEIPLLPLCSGHMNQIRTFCLWNYTKLFHLSIFSFLSPRPDDLKKISNCLNSILRHEYFKRVRSCGICDKT